MKNKKEISAWEKVEIARNPKRKTSLEYIELHGDRNFKDDKAIICGLAKIDNTPFTIIAEQKGRTTKENIERNFGMPNPESYRKAIRFMKQAEKFKRPVITFIDTKGAYPGIEAEERGQGEAIAKSMFEMARLKVPVNFYHYLQQYSLTEIDKIIPEKNEISEENFSKTSEILKKEIIKEIKKSNKMTSEQIVEERYKKFRNITSFNVI